MGFPVWKQQLPLTLGSTEPSLQAGGTGAPREMAPFLEQGYTHLPCKPHIPWQSPLQPGRSPGRTPLPPVLTVLGPARSAKSRALSERIGTGALGLPLSLWELWQSLSALEIFFTFFYISLWIYSWPVAVVAQPALCLQFFL